MRCSMHSIALQLITIYPHAPTPDLSTQGSKLCKVAAHEDGEEETL